MNVEAIKNEIKVQTGWDDDELKEAMEIARKELEDVIGSKVDEELVLTRLVDMYDEIEIEELKLQEVLGERVKYTDIDLENFPDEETCGKAFQDIFRGKCLAGCVVSMFRGTYMPQGATKKAKRLTVYIQDESGQFQVDVFGKNENVISKWDDISVGDYVEITNVKVLERMEKNPDFDKEMEEDPEDNPKYIPTGEPKFWFLFGSENLESMVQKIPPDKYPELPSLEQLFECKTMRVFESADGGRYITNGVILSIDKDVNGKNGRTIRGRFLVQFGKKMKQVICFFQKSATKTLPTNHSELRALRLRVLGYYNPENNTYKIDKILSAKKLGTNRKLVEIKTKTKKEKEPTKEEQLQNILTDIFQEMIENGEDGIIEFNDLIHYDLPDEYSIDDVVKALQERDDITMVEPMTCQFKIGRDENTNEDTNDDASVNEVKKKDIPEEKPKGKPEDEQEYEIERYKTILLNCIKGDMNNPRGVIQYVKMLTQVKKGSKIVEEAYKQLLDDNRIREEENGEKVVLNLDALEELDEKSEKELDDLGLYYEIVDYLYENKGKSCSLAQIQKAFPNVDIRSVMKQEFNKNVKLTYENKKAEIRVVAPNKWRFVFL
ncbi:MAG: hypothetical protein DRI44_06105 [Chlamydiae bacterium]|nr:MAG: hypothetical protein DRI44_06105 [Chlamydiota bacterium]